MTTSESVSLATGCPCRRTTAAAGFTLIELIVVLGVLGVLLGGALPLAGAVIDSERRQAVAAELDAIARALENHWFDRQSFPTTLRATTFFGVYLQPGPGNTCAQDAWGGNVDYVYSINTTTSTATVHSRGENGIDDGLANEDFGVTVYAAVPGLAKTRLRMRVIVEAMANFLEAGGTLTGTWSVDCAAMGLGSEYATDGFGTAFTLTPSTLTLRSAGPDRLASTSDDLTT